MDHEERILELNGHHFERDSGGVETEKDDEVLVTGL